MDNLIKTKKKYSIAISAYAIPGIVMPKTPKTLTQIFESFCKANGLSLESLKQKRRFFELVAIRQTFCKWTRENTNTSASTIGRIINRDHATVLHSHKTATNRIEANEKEFMEIYHRCLKAL